MPRIRDANPKNISGGYDRLFGIPELGLLMSKVQSTVISSGSELEKIIISKARGVEDLDSFLNNRDIGRGTYLATSRQVKKSKLLKVDRDAPDFIIIVFSDIDTRSHIVELKDGHVFDTKKADAERRALHGFLRRNDAVLPGIASAHFCAFNQEDKNVIWEGAKKTIPYQEIMTGRELCEILRIDYDEIVASRSGDRPDNVNYFITELLRIPDIRRLIETIINRGK